MNLALTLSLLAGLLAGQPTRTESRLVPGKFGKALDASVTPLAFGGDVRYRTPPLTVECWAKLASKRDFNVLVSCDPKTSAQHWEIYSYASTGAFSAYLPGYEPSVISSKKNICDGAWHHLAMTFDASLVRLFVDGKPVHEQVVRPRAGLKPLAGPLAVGMAIDGSSRVGCDGQIDEVRISRVIREITLPGAAPAVDADTIAVWRFDDTDSILADPAWTPPPVTSGEAWERMTDPDWVDARLRKMDTGPTFNGTFAYDHRGNRVNVFKGTAIRVGDKGEGAVLFDRGQFQMQAGWTGGYLHHSDRRFGLLNTPTPAGTMVFSAASPPTSTIPPPRDTGRYRGMYLHGKRVVLSYTVGDTLVRESPWLEKVGDQAVLTRTFEVSPSKVSRTLFLGELPGYVENRPGAFLAVSQTKPGQEIVIQAQGVENAAGLMNGPGGKISLFLPASEQLRRFRVAYWSGPNKNRAAIGKALARQTLSDLTEWMKPGPARFAQELVTKGEVAKDTAPYVVDTLTIPYDNPWNALFFCTGLDFLPDGRIAVCTCHGDVWLVKADADLAKVRWKRFATGLYHPLGLKVIAGQVVVLERGQLTRLHDLDGDGDADVYENLCHDWHTGSGEHSYDTCLETDSRGNFYFFKTGDGHLPHGGTLLRVSADGKTVEVFATGFRHPIGLSVGPADQVTGADQEGNWMPVTRVDSYKKGGFYGDMRTHHRLTAPLTYDPPLLWLPKDWDNSAGGQVWTTDNRFGWPRDQLLHLSYGRCKLYALLIQKVGDLEQAAAVDLGVRFLSGSARGRFHPTDGTLYVCGLNGWQTAAKKDGSLQRVRYTGKPLLVPTGFEVLPEGIRLQFGQVLDAKSVQKERFRIEQWNYRWSADYGSKRWSVANPSTMGQDTVPVDGVRLSEDGKSVLLQVRGLRPVMQMKVSFDLATHEGQPVMGFLYNTIHRLGSGK